MLDTLPFLTEEITFPPVKRNSLDTLQVNLGYLCNQQCTHCHVNAGPKRKEIMSKDIIDSIITFIKNNPVKVLDITGGAPEMNPNFKYLVENSASYVNKIIDRCNLTILSEPGYENYVEFLKKYNVEIVASLPCYTEDNVDKQRGKGVFDSSIRIIKLLNAAGYGEDNSGLVLDFVYNPDGPFLPPDQKVLESDYKQILLKKYNIKFNHLFTITNMPIKRFGSMLLSKNLFHEYMQSLKLSFNPESMQSLMCLNMLSVSWDGYLYDCDFNQMLDVKVTGDNDKPAHISSVSLENISKNIQIAEHCYGCTAGQGSSCGGALI